MFLCISCSIACSQQANAVWGWLDMGKFEPLIPNIFFYISVNPATQWFQEAFGYICINKQLQNVSDRDDFTVDCAHREGLKIYISTFRGHEEQHCNVNVLWTPLGTTPGKHLHKALSPVSQRHRNQVEIISQTIRRRSVCDVENNPVSVTNPRSFQQTRLRTETGRVTIPWV